MALLANQIMDARILSSMNGRVELSQFLRVSNQSIVSQVNSGQDDNRKNRKYPCPLCGKRFRFNSILSLHMRTHTGEKPFKCPYCDHRAAQKGNLKIHLRTHKQGILGKGRGKIREENRLLHELEERAILRDRQIRAAHIGQQQPHTSNTNQLQQPFLHAAPAEPPFSRNSGAAAVQPHASISPKVTTVPDEPIQPQTTGFRCSFCKGKFRKQQELERHIRILHKPYKCTLCEFAAAQEEELIGHVEMIHITSDSGPGQKPSAGVGDKGKPVGEFPCEVCGQTFSQAWFLKGHMRKHKDSFEHCCQICGRRFKEPWFLKNHMKVHLNKLAAKNNIPSDRETSVEMCNLTKDHQSDLYSQYMSRIHNRFLTPERADLPDYNHMMASAGTDVKVRELLGRMISSAPDAEGSSLSGLNHLHPPLSSTGMEYLQKVISVRNALSNNSYAGWQIMTPGLTSERQIFSPKDQQQEQCSSYLPEICLAVDESQLCISDPDTSKPGSPGSNMSLHGPTEAIPETRNSLSSCAPDHRSQSSSPTGENVYRCPPSGDNATAQASLMGFHLDRYHFPHWQNNRDLSSPLRPTSSSSPKTRPRSRDDWSPTSGQFLRLEGEKTADHIEKETREDGSVIGKPKKSQYEPLDLSVRPDSIPSQSAVLLQMSGLFSNGLSSSITRRLQSYPNAPAELSMKPTYQCDLLVQATKEEINSQSSGSIGHDEDEYEKCIQGREDKNDNPAKWKMLTGADFEELAEVKHWGKGVDGSPMASLESLTPGQTAPLQHHSALLSFLRSQGNLTNTPAIALKSSLNSGGNMEQDIASAQKPFKCRYCPYSASQKGNLKTHVLCVHRKPFDNSLYPDRRLRRSHAPHVPRLPMSITGDNCMPGRDQIGVTSLCGT